MNLSLAMVLSLERPMRDLRVGGATRAAAPSGTIGSLFAKDGANLTVCVHVHDVLGLVRVTSIETGAAMNVTVTSAQLFSIQCAVRRSEMMRLVETLSCAAEKR